MVVLPRAVMLAVAARQLASHITRQSDSTLAVWADQEYLPTVSWRFEGRTMLILRMPCSRDPAVGLSEPSWRSQGEHPSSHFWRIMQNL